MSESDNPANAFQQSKSRVGYIPRTQASSALYASLGFRCGLEVHQQLHTDAKLFCRCPAGSYQRPDDFDAQLVRHMRPTLSELGEYDGTALMEFKTKKNIVYRIKGKTACTYDIDDTPPFAMNRQALDIAIEIALALGTQVVGELHITRKQYLDGSIPTGFQRTGIVGIHGEIPLATKRVRILQLSIEEDSCREISDIGHERIYSTDRLGMPLVETVTYPDLLTPDEAAEAAQHIRYLTRSTGKVNVGIGAGREDVNVSIEGGTRVEIKGVQRIRWIPDLTHNEAFRQKALLAIRDELRDRVLDPSAWEPSFEELSGEDVACLGFTSDEFGVLVAINLPSFAGLLSHFTNPGRCFADELSDRLKVVACIEKPNLVHSEDANDMNWAGIKTRLRSEESDAQILVWGQSDDVKTALETIDERCRMAFEGVPNETRKALPDGTTLFERVLPGPDRMYPDTDSAPIPIPAEHVERIRATLPTGIASRLDQLRAWEIPSDCWSFLLKRNLVPTLDRLINEEGLEPTQAGTLLGHVVRNLSGDFPEDVEWVISIVRGLAQRALHTDLLRPLLAAAVKAPGATFDELLNMIGYEPHARSEILARVPDLAKLFSPTPRRSREVDRRNWLMGQLRPLALGNMPLGVLAEQIQEDLNDCR